MEKKKWPTKETAHDTLLFKTNISEKIIFDLFEEIKDASRAAQERCIPDILCLAGHGMYSISVYPGMSKKIRKKVREFVSKLEIDVEESDRLKEEKIHRPERCKSIAGTLNLLLLQGKITEEDALQWIKSYSQSKRE